MLSGRGEPRDFVLHELASLQIANTMPSICQVISLYSTDSKRSLSGDMRWQALDNENPSSNPFTDKQL